jgi:hypothetical protein
MDETRPISDRPRAEAAADRLGDRSAPRPTTGADADPFVQAGAEIAELMRRFIEEVGSLRRDAQIEAEAARVERADAARIRQAAMRLRVDAEAEATRIVDAARGEANRIREQAKAQTSDAKRVVHGVVDHLEQARDSLAELIGRLGEDIDDWTAPQEIPVIPDASDETSVA